MVFIYTLIQETPLSMEVLMEALSNSLETFM